MKNVRILDCTLRDGGRVIEGDCAFSNEEIREISLRLANAKIDIIEIGFLRDWRKVEYKGNSTFFTDVNQIKPFLDKSKKNVMYVAFVDYGLFDFESLGYWDGTSIDGIRFGFTKKNYEESYDDIVKCANSIKEKGYKLFMQGVNSLNYNDKELLELVDLMNEIQPYSFGIVDTYGAMYMDDVDRIYGLIDHNMKEEICIDFHSHNNYQLSFAFAQEIIKLSDGKREVIIDATLDGMGKVAGNLNTELLVDYLVRKKYYDYEFENILDIIDDYIYKYKVKKDWGYSVPAMLSGIYKSHPNNIIYLTQKMRLETKDIKNVIAMIEPLKRQRYDYGNIESLYLEYIADKVDDSQSIEKLKNIFGGREVLVLVPGNTLNTYETQIKKYVERNKLFIISVNFVMENENSFAFFGNEKRYKKLKNKRRGHKVIISSNIKSEEETDIIVNYHSLINRGFKYFENSAIMLLNLLKKLDVRKINIAGLDGFKKETGNNYTDESFQNDRHINEFSELNRDIGSMLEEVVKVLHGKCEVELITPSVYETIVRKAKKN